MTTRAVAPGLYMPFPNHRTMKVVMEREQDAVRFRKMIDELESWGLNRHAIARRLGISMTQVRQRLDGESA